MAILTNRRETSLRELTVADYSKTKLLTYADSFRELATCLVPEEPEESGDRQQTLEQYRERERQQALCEHMKEMSRILTKVAIQTFFFGAFSERQRRKVVQGLRLEKIMVLDLYYIHEGAVSEEEGHCSIGAKLYSERPGGYSVQDVADMLSVLLDKRLSPSVSSPLRVDREIKSFVFVEEPDFVVVSGYAKAIKENETISGDNYTLLETVKGELSVLLADGMGSGENAERDSAKVLEMMEKFLDAGADMDVAMQLVNNALSVMTRENMSTLDVCTIDLYSGMCRFRKAGAATTFLKSNSYVEQITIPSLPLGIFRERESEAVTRELIENDFLIMVTDGVIDALEANGYEDMLQRYIEDMQEQTPGEMAQKILQFVLRCSGGRIADDMTVVVLGIYRNA